MSCLKGVSIMLAAITVNNYIKCYVWKWILWVIMRKLFILIGHISSIWPTVIKKKTFLETIIRATRIIFKIFNFARENHIFLIITIFHFTKTDKYSQARRIDYISCDRSNKSFLKTSREWTYSWISLNVLRIIRDIILSR